MKASERLTDEGLITRIKEPKPGVGKKQNPEVVQPGAAVFRMYLAFDKEVFGKELFLLPHDGETAGGPGGEVQNI